MPPELLVPASERKRTGGWRLAILRAWAVLGVAVAWLVLVNGDGPVHFHEAIFTLAGFYAVWQVVGWITRPVLPPDDGQR